MIELILWSNYILFTSPDIPYKAMLTAMTWIDSEITTWICPPGAYSLHWHRVYVFIYVSYIIIHLCLNGVSFLSTIARDETTLGGQWLHITRVVIPGVDCQLSLHAMYTVGLYCWYTDRITIDCMHVLFICNHLVILFVELCSIFYSVVVICSILLLSC